MVPEPSFLVAGVQKGGTTALHQYLSRHPEVFVPHVKELNYFSLNYERGPEWYAKQFASAPPGAVIGEVSPLYCHVPGALERIAQDLPRTRIIVCLRNPVDRAYSNYWFNVARHAQDPRVPFAEATATPDGRERYIAKGRYEQLLRRSLSLFGRTRLTVLTTEDLAADPNRALGRVWEAIGVRLLSLEPLDANVTSYPRHRGIAATFSDVRNRLKPLGRRAPRAVADRLRSLEASAQNALMTDDRPRLSPVVRSEMVDLFESDIAFVEEFLGQPLNHWRRRS